MTHAFDPSKPAQPTPSPQATSAPDPADFGTCYGMEMSIETPGKPAPAEDDLSDPLAWIRRWIERHKTV